MNTPTVLPVAPVSDRTVVQQPVLAIGLVLMAVTLFSILDVTSKIMTVDYSPIELIWARNLAMLIGLAPFVLRVPDALQSSRPVLQTVRGLAVTASALLFIAGLRRLQMAEATAIGFASPLLVTAMSIPFLGERVGPRRWAAVAVGFVGVLIVLRPGTAAFDPYVLFPLGSAITWALTTIVTRRMGAEPPLTTLFFSTVAGLVATTLFVPAVWTPPTTNAVLAMIGLAVVGAGGQYLFIAALMRGPASLIAPFSYCQMLWSVLWGFVVFGAVPAPATWIGGGVIIASGLYILHREQQLRRRIRRRDSQEGAP
jgi:drug/metabolite transporter (DMT)-like permease